MVGLYQKAHFPPKGDFSILSSIYSDENMSSISPVGGVLGVIDHISDDQVGASREKVIHNAP
jgi:hypothetical protein